MATKPVETDDTFPPPIKGRGPDAGKSAAELEAITAERTSVPESFRDGQPVEAEAEGHHSEPRATRKARK